MSTLFVADRSAHKPTERGSARSSFSDRHRASLFFLEKQKSMAPLANIIPPAGTLLFLTTDAQRVRHERRASRERGLVLHRGQLGRKREKPEKRRRNRKQRSKKDRGRRQEKERTPPKGDSFFGTQKHQETKLHSCARRIVGLEKGACTTALLQKRARISTIPFSFQRGRAHSLYSQP